ncbi:MAG TPA: HAMP domain-containing sensor histidine kinase [Noviherbaspirillum sp.]|nr:HAMP domain-containing sensor histidine kinase [Noviherbaspirillum sp.]
MIRSLRLFAPRSFSFRVGIIIFLALCVILATARVVFYFQSIEAARASVRRLLDAHVEEIANGYERNGAAYARSLVEGIVEEGRDKNLYLEFQQGESFSGNLAVRPYVPLRSRGVFEVEVPREDDDAQHLMFRVYEYPNNVVIRAAYDMESVDLLRRTLLASLAANAVIAFALSLLLSFLIVKLFDRYFRNFNVACNEIMSGNLDYRIATTGGKDEFEKLAANLNRMLDWLKGLLGMIKDSNNAIAHDIRTPLSRLRLEMSALAQEPGLSGALRAKVEKQIEQVDGLVDMFDSLLVIAKAESRSGVELFEAFDLAQLVREVSAFYAPILEEKGLPLTLDLPGYALAFTGDKQLISQALVNLLDNASKYSRDGGEIVVSLFDGQDAVRLTVADRGAGIPPALMHKARERFVRGDASRHSKGYGLGLSLVNAVATLHHGELRLEDNLPGLRATLLLHRLG